MTGVDHGTVAATSLLESALDDLPGVDLATLDDRAALQRRTERKYLLPPSAALALVADLPVGARVLEVDGRRGFGYRSVYFDTPERSSYLATARQRPRRVKVRTRTYTDSGACMLECKSRAQDGQTIKHRTPHPEIAHDLLTADARSFVAAHWVDGPVDRLIPVLTTRYRRTTLLLQEGARVTVDAHLRWTDGRQGLRLDDRVLVETKGTGLPTSIDRALWRLGHRPVTVSKFGTGLAALDPQLPHNRWHRTLARHFPT